MSKRIPDCTKSNGQNLIKETTRENNKCVYLELKKNAFAINLK